MNKPLLCRLLSIIAVLIGISMLFSIPWALPICGGDWRCEQRGFWGLLASVAVCFAAGELLRRLGRNCHGQLFQKEAMAVVGLSWVLATVLGALPFFFSGTYRAPRERMNYADAMFEAQSGFSTTGATVLSDLENPELVPRCILFWRSSTHFLGGMGIIVLFVAILGQGSAGKALMKAEMPGPSKSTPQARVQHTAWVLFFVYTGLNAALTAILMLENLSLFDALCHSFGTMATGGYSTYNASVGYFATRPDLYNGPLIEMTIALFMFLAGTNFMLLYALLLFQPRRLLADVEWRTYAAIILAAIVLVTAAGFYSHNFPNGLGDGIRAGVFQVVSIMTSTGFCTADFDKWNSFGKGMLLILMFIGGCAGSTGGGLKVIRHILFVKILGLEMEQTFHPTVVRPLRLGGEPVEDQTLRKQILVYFGLILIISIAAWLFTVSLEPDSTWTDHGHMPEHKLIDAASCVATTLNNIGPGFGVVGPTKNYTHFHWYTKTMFVWLMMIGRLEIYVILVLFMPSFWRTN